MITSFFSGIFTLHFQPSSTSMSISHTFVPVSTVLLGVSFFKSSTRRIYYPAILSLSLSLPLYRCRRRRRRRGIESDVKGALSGLPNREYRLLAHLQPYSYRLHIPYCLNNLLCLFFSLLFHVIARSLHLFFSTYLSCICIYIQIYIYSLSIYSRLFPFNSRFDDFEIFLAFYFSISFSTRYISQLPYLSFILYHLRIIQLCCT